MSRHFMNRLLLVTAVSCAVMTPVAQAGDTLGNNGWLKLGEKLTSNNGRYSLEIYKGVVDVDGSRWTSMGLSIREEGVGKIWHVGPFFSVTDTMPFLAMQENGDLCLYSQSGPQKTANEITLHWHSAETRAVQPDKRVIMQDDGNLCVYWLERAAIWWSKNEGNGQGVGYKTGEVKPGTIRDRKRSPYY